MELAFCRTGGSFHKRRLNTIADENDARRAGTVRALHAAHIDGRKDIVAAMLTEDSTFSSPRDDHIDRDA